jgi:hypothetical protein
MTTTPDRVSGLVEVTVPSGETAEGELHTYALRGREKMSQNVAAGVRAAKNRRLLLGGRCPVTLGEKFSRVRARERVTARK